MMIKTRNILILCLLAQLGLWIALQSWNTEGGGVGVRALVTLDAPITAVEIVDESGATVQLAHVDERWRVASAESFPANRVQVEKLLEALSKLTTQRQVGNTAVAAKQFKLGEDNFVRKITLSAGDNQDVLLIGSSPSFRHVHARRMGDKRSYIVPFNAYEAQATAEAWYDRKAYAIAPADIANFSFQDNAVTRHEDGSFRRSDDAEAVLSADLVQPLFGKVTQVGFAEVLGVEEQKSYRLERSKHVFAVDYGEGLSREYRFSPLRDDSYHVLKVSDLPFYFKITKGAFAPIAELSWGDFVAPVGDGESESVE